MIRVGILSRFFSLPAGYIFLTPEEADLIATRCARLPPSCIIGSGVEPVATGVAAPLEHLGITDPFVLYLGRVERNKGCETLLRYFLQYVETSGRKLQLVMAGPANVEIPDHPQIKALGFVHHDVREALLSRARALIMPSPFESLSLVLLEAWNHALPAIVNAHCGVLKGQVRRADGGLYYRHVNEFIATLDFILDNPEVARQLGRQGLAYVDREYRWPTVMQRLEGFLGQP